MSSATHQAPQWYTARHSYTKIWLRLATENLLGVGPTSNPKHVMPRCVHESATRYLALFLKYEVEYPVSDRALPLINSLVLDGPDDGSVTCSRGRAKSKVCDKFDSCRTLNSTGAGGQRGVYMQIMKLLLVKAVMSCSPAFATPDLRFLRERRLFRTLQPPSRFHILYGRPIARARGGGGGGDRSISNGRVKTIGVSFWSSLRETHSGGIV